MHKATTDPTLSNFEPVLLAKIAPNQVRELFPGVEFLPIDDLAEPEPSIGAIFQLRTGRRLGVILGNITGSLTVLAPDDTDAAEVLRELTEEVLLPPTSITWRRPNKGGRDQTTGRASDLPTVLRQLVEERIALEVKLQHEPGELADARVREYDGKYQSLQRRLATMFRDAGEDAERVTVMLEMMRILENRLVYLQNFIVDATAENKGLAELVTQFIDELSREKSPVLTTLEATYFRAVAALYAGDLAAAREGFSAACASEESDEANDIKYKSYVILGHLSHEEEDYAKAKELHEQSLRYSPNDNVTAQALALKALNSYALGDHDEALHLFQEALTLFDENKPFFNSYFFRNALLFCGAIYFDRKEYDDAASFYRRVSASVDQSSFDYFDALSHIGRIEYAKGNFDEAVASFERAVQTHRFSENEYVVDTWFWLARCHLRRDESEEARKYLEKIAATEVHYDKKPQAVELLQRIA